MQTATTRFRTIFAALLVFEAAACALFIVSRPPIDPVGWHFLEKQRPKADPDGGATFSIVADGLSFAVFRRPLGGWETRFGHLFQMLNIFPCLVAMLAFQILQILPFFNSKLNSDIATLIFCVVAVAQFAAVAAFVNRITSRRRSNSG